MSTSISKGAILEQLLSFHAPEQLLEHSMLIYGNNDNVRKKSLNTILRHHELTIPQLSEEHNKIERLVKYVLEENIYVSEDAQEYILESHNIIKHRLKNDSSMNVQVSKFYISLYEDSLFPRTKTDSSNYLMENVLYETSDEQLNLLEPLVNADMLTPSQILTLFRYMLDSSHLSKEESNSIKDNIILSLVKILNYEMKRKEYRDLPVLHCMSNIYKLLSYEYFDLENCLSEIEDIFKEFYEQTQEILHDFFLEEQIASDNVYNADPFNLQNLIPFSSVGERTITRSIYDIALANDDDAIEEALTNFSRVCSSVHALSYDICLEGSGIQKKVREISRNVRDNVNNSIQKGKKKSSERKAAIKNVIDPMVNYIEDIFLKIRDKDREARRNIIIKGGVVPKILRWIKRAIPLIIIGKFGNVGAVISGISLIAMVATDAKEDKKVRTQILRELEEELKICEEKIEDSRGDEDKQKKYELMRIRSQLQQNIDKIRLNLKY